MLLERFERENLGKKNRCFDSVALGINLPGARDALAPEGIGGFRVLWPCWALQDSRKDLRGQMNILNTNKYLSPLPHAHSYRGMEGNGTPGISHCTGMLGWDLGLGMWEVWAAFHWDKPQNDDLASLWDREQSPVHGSNPLNPKSSFLSCQPQNPHGLGSWRGPCWVFGVVVLGVTISVSVPEAG